MRQRQPRHGHARRQLALPLIHGNKPILVLDDPDDASGSDSVGVLRFEDAVGDEAQAVDDGYVDMGGW